MLPADRPARLSDLIDETDWMEIECPGCGRHGRLRISERSASYGPDELARTLVEHLTADCPRKGETRVYEIWQLRCPSLVRFSSLRPKR